MSRKGEVRLVRFGESAADNASYHQAQKNRPNEKCNQCLYLNEGGVAVHAYEKCVFCYLADMSSSITLLEM